MNRENERARGPFLDHRGYDCRTEKLLVKMATVCESAAAVAGQLLAGFRSGDKVCLCNIF